MQIANETQSLKLSNYSIRLSKRYKNKMMKDKEGEQVEQQNIIRMFAFMYQ